MRHRPLKARAVLDSSGHLPDDIEADRVTGSFFPAKIPRFPALSEIPPNERDEEGQPDASTQIE